MASTLKCDTIQNASSATANLTLDDAGNATVGNTLVMGSSFKRNRIINGDMRVDQRNAGASVAVTTASPFSVDRWNAFASVNSKYTIQQTPSSTETGYAARLAAGFQNYLGCTSSSSYSLSSTDFFLVGQRIEGFNTSDLNWGSATGAKSVTLSFWAYSSLTGTFGGAINNSAQNYTYPFSYSIPVANTWTYINITIPGPTSGTWIGATNGVGLGLYFSIGTGSSYSTTAGSWVAGTYYSVTGATSVVGTNGATFYITGVQLEVGSVATPYERQIYSEQLAQCQRYYALNLGTVGFSSTTTIINYILCGPVSMRAAPSPSLFATSSVLLDYNVAYRNASSITLQTYQTTNGIEVNIVPSTATTGSKAQGISPNCVALSAEL